MPRQRKFSTVRGILWVGFAAYILWMLWLLFGQRLGTHVYTQHLAERVNLHPFATVRRYVTLLQNSQSPGLLRHAVVNLAGNIVMFVPLGFFLPCVFWVFRRFYRTFLTCLILIVLIEWIQYITGLGTCDVDDVILNLMGISIGYPCSKIRLGKGKPDDNVLNERK